MMNTTKLVVGEDVYIREDVAHVIRDKKYSGHCWGKATKITSLGVEIDLTASDRVYKQTRTQGGPPLVESVSVPTMFDPNGKACDDSVWELAFEDTDDHYPIGTKLKPLEKILPNKSWGTTLE
jgi:hypothetical protein